MLRVGRRPARKSEESLEKNGAGTAAGEKKAGPAPVPVVNTSIPGATLRFENWFSADTGGRTAMIRSVASMTGRHNFCSCMVPLSFYHSVCLIAAHTRGSAATCR